MICIVDDDESVLEATKCLVRSLGYNAVTFSSAEEFLDSGCVKGTACLITDVQMPGLDGIETGKRILCSFLSRRSCRIRDSRIGPGTKRCVSQCQRATPGAPTISIYLRNGTDILRA